MNYTSILINIFALIGMIVSFGLGYMHGRSVERFKQSENNSDDTKKVYISKEDIEIPKSDYNAICANKEDDIIAHDTCRRIANNGTPLSNVLFEIKEEIDELDYLVDDAMYSDNETRVHNVSYLMDSIYEIINKHIGKVENEIMKKSCNTCKNNDDELSGECYECLKGIFDHYEAESEDKG